MLPHRRALATFLRAFCLAGLVALGGCQRSANPAVTPKPSSSQTPRNTPDPVLLSVPSLVRLSMGWTREVTVVRRDSILITTATGAKQMERRSRTLRFTLNVGTNGSLKISLDTVIYQPAAALPDNLIGTVWTGKIDSRGRMNPLAASRRSTVVEEISSTVADLLPPISPNGISVGMSWSDTSVSNLRVDAFSVGEERRSAWRVGERTSRGQLLLLPLLVRQSYEQVGKVTQAGREMNMTAQGTRTGTWNFTLLGLPESANFSESAASLITIKGTQQAIPAMQYRTTTIKYQTRD